MSSSFQGDACINVKLRNLHLIARSMQCMCVAVDQPARSSARTKLAPNISQSPKDRALRSGRREALIVVNIIEISLRCPLFLFLKGYSFQKQRDNGPFAATLQQSGKYQIAWWGRLLCAWMLQSTCTLCNKPKLCSIFDESRLSEAQRVPGLRNVPGIS